MRNPGEFQRTLNEKSVGEVCACDDGGVAAFEVDAAFTADAICASLSLDWRQLIEGPCYACEGLPPFPYEPGRRW